MSATLTASPSLITVEEFVARPDAGYPQELLRGRIARRTSPGPRHGQICSQVVYLLRRLLDERDLGHVLSNDSGVITERNPDTMRGADVAFYSYASVPRGQLPSGYLEVAPELVLEVRPPGDRWSEIYSKAGEYTHAGVAAVVVLDDQGGIL